MVNTNKPSCFCAVSDVFAISEVRKAPVAVAFFEKLLNFCRAFASWYCGKNGHFNICSFAFCYSGIEVFVRLVCIMQQLRNKLPYLFTDCSIRCENKPVPMAMVGDKREGRRTLNALWAVLPELCCILINCNKQLRFSIIYLKPEFWPGFQTFGNAQGRNLPQFWTPWLGRLPSQRAPVRMLQEECQTWKPFTSSCGTEWAHL